MAEQDHDDREGIEPEVLDEDADDPAVAFHALRQTVEDIRSDLKQEVRHLRKGVEAVFAELDKQGPPEDYKPELAQLVQQLGIVAERLHGVEQSPILRQGAQHYARVLEHTGENLLRSATNQLERQAGDLERMTGNLARHVAGARDRQRQNWWLLTAGLAGIAAGVAFTLFLPAILPFSAAPRVASIVMADTPWRAGMDLMAFGNREAWNRVAAADRLFQANKDVMTACQEAAAKAGKDQRCTITVSSPRQ